MTSAIRKMGDALINGYAMRKNSVFLILLFSVCGCRSYEEGYTKGQSDSVKELYWAQAEMQKQKGNSGKEEVDYYIYEGQKVGPDGVRYGEHKIRIPVIK